VFVGHEGGRLWRMTRSKEATWVSQGNTTTKQGVFGWQRRPWETRQQMTMVGIGLDGVRRCRGDCGDICYCRDHGHVCGSRRSELTNCLGENPGGTLGPAQANPCCWLTPIGPQLANCQAPCSILWDAASLLMNVLSAK